MEYVSQHRTCHDGVAKVFMFTSLLLGLILAFFDVLVLIPMQHHAHAVAAQVLLVETQCECIWTDSVTVS